MLFVSHKYFPNSTYRNNITSYLTLTNLSPHTRIEITSVKPGRIDPSNSLDIIGVRQSPEFTQPMSSPNNSGTTYHLTTTGETLSFGFVSDSSAGSSGFAFSYTGRYHLSQNNGVHSHCWSVSIYTIEIYVKSVQACTLRHGVFKASDINYIGCWKLLVILYLNDDM